MRRTKPALLEIAESSLDVARQEAKEGYAKKDERGIRDAAEKAWNAALQATDHAMRAHGMTPEPGRAAHRDPHEFLETLGRRDLSKELSYFADRMHGECFCQGNCPTKEGMDVTLKEVRGLRPEDQECVLKGPEPDHN